MRAVTPALATFDGVGKVLARWVQFYHVNDSAALGKQAPRRLVAVGGASFPA